MLKLLKIGVEIFLISILIIQHAQNLKELHQMKNEMRWNALICSIVFFNYFAKLTPAKMIAK